MKNIKEIIEDLKTLTIAEIKEMNTEELERLQTEVSDIVKINLALNDKVTLRTKK